MYNPTVHRMFHDLEKLSCSIRTEVDTFMSSVIEWADELAGIIEKEFTVGSGSAVFLLPKTPSEKKTHNRKAKNTVSSKSSVINSTFLHNETTSNLDNTASVRTRSARRAATSKMSQLNVTKNMHDILSEETVQTSLIGGKNENENMGDATFVMPKASTRTKPVLKNKQPEIKSPELINPESEKNENQILNSSNVSSEKESPPKKISRTGGTPSVRSNRRKAPSESPIQRPSTRKTPTAVDEDPAVRSTRRKSSRALSGSPVQRSSVRKLFRTLSGSPVVRSSSVSGPRSASKSPVVRSSSLRSRKNTSISPVKRSSKTNTSTSQANENRSSLVNKTVTIKKESIPKIASTCSMIDETWNDVINDEEKTPIAKDDGFFRLSKTSTPARDPDKTPVASAQNLCNELDENLVINAEPENVTENGGNVEAADEILPDVEVQKKKRKLKKDEEVKENIEEIADTVRITRTKSKAIKQMMEENETKQADLSAFAKKLLNRAKVTSMKKNQLAALLECNSSTPKNGPTHIGSCLPFGNLTASKSKYHLLLSSSKKLKTPLATFPNSGVKIAKVSGNKELSKLKVASRDSSVENTVRNKFPVDIQERELKLKSKKEKEKEAALKRQDVIKSKQEELKRKNELKHQMAMKQREKLEQEKFNNMIQSEKEKEERHKLILQERQMKLKEEALKKKMLTQQKIAETVERRRIEEEARIAKLKEMEAEEQRLALEKQKEQERQEKRAQERLAQKKAREEYEMRLKQELEAERLKTEKLLTAKKGLSSASKLQSASKRQKFGIIGSEKREWDYKPRNENDYGLEDEHSEVESEDEKSYDKSKPAIPWAKKIMQGKSAVVKVLTLEMLCEFMPCYQKSPDIHKMFKMTPSKRIKRSSSAIWNTPSS